MPVETLPHWTFPANWREPVTERLEWRTAVLASVTASEQAFATRMSPRRTFEVMTTPVGSQRTRFDLAVGAIGVDPWYIPIWHDGTQLLADASGGGTSLSVVTVDREFKVGGFAMLTDHSARSEVVEIASVATGALTLAEPLALSWPAGTAIYPAVKARLTEQPQMERRANRAFEGFVRFITTEANDYEPASTLTTYRDLPVLTTPPNEAVDMTHAYERIFDEIDGDVGLVSRSHTSQTGITIQGYNWTALGRAEQAQLRAVLYYMQGRNNPVWLPTFAEDFDVVSVGTGLVVRECGFTTFGGPREGRQDVQIALTNGTSLFRRIASSTLTFNGTENLVFTESLSGVTMADIHRVSFMSQCRLNADSIEIVHVTDSDGVAQVAAQFRTAPATRSALDYEPAYLGDTVPNADLCGVSTGCVPEIVDTGFRLVVSAAVSGQRRTNVTILETRSADFVAYITTEDSTVRFGSTRSSVSVDEAAFSPPPAVLPSISRGLLTGCEGVEDFTFAPVLSFANGTNVLRFYQDGSSLGAYTASSNPIIDLWQPTPNALYLTTFDGSTVRAGTSNAVGALANEYEVTSGAFDEVWARPSGSFAGGLLVTRDASTKKLSMFSIFFFGDFLPPLDDPIITPLGFVSDVPSNREKIVTARNSSSELLAVWRGYSGPTGPQGSVRVRPYFGGSWGVSQTLFNITALTVPGYTNLGNREPVAAAITRGGGVAMVERRYEAVGGQLRAYEVLVLHTPFQPTRQSNVIRLTTPGVGPTGDVRRSADIKVLGAGTTMVVYENPVDNTGTTELVSRTFRIEDCGFLGIDDDE